MKVRATVATIATSIVSVKADVKRGEKVFNAYMMWSPFVLIVGWCVGRLGCSLSALLLSIVTNGLSPHRVMPAL